MKNPISEINYLRNSKRLLHIVSDLISEYEKDFPTDRMMSTCKPEITKWIVKSVKYTYHDEIATWKDFDTDYIRISHILIIQTINNIIDNFHESRGIILKDKFLMPSYLHVLHHCVDWAYDHGELTKEEYDKYGFSTR